MLRHPPYIGITGFTSRKEVEAVLSLLPAEPPYRLMVGVLASWRTMWHEKSHHYPKRYPDVLDIGSIFKDDPRVLNLIHYHTRIQDSLYSQLYQLTKLGGPSVHGLQLNITWPDQNSLETYRNHFPNMVVVLQLNSHCFESCEHRASNLARMVATYKGLIDYALIDGSGGTGKKLDYEKTAEYIRALREIANFDVIGVAGGLEAETIPDIAGLKRLNIRLSIDAEGKLRNLSDDLDLKKVGAYLEKAHDLFCV